jgi:pilus assembly protein Flp/PilA
MTTSLWRTIGEFLRREDGPTAVEYAVMLSLIIVVCLAAISVVGQKASGTFDSVARTMGS